MSRTFDANLANFLSRAPVITGYPFTVSLWFKTTDNSLDQCLWAEADEATNDECWAVHIDGATHYLRGMTKHVSGSYAVKPTVVSNGVWHNALFVCSSSTHRSIYLDGNYDAGSNDLADLTPAGLDNCTVGELKRATSYWPMSGLIDEVTAWSVALSTGDIATVAGGADPSTIQAGSILGHWRLLGTASPEPEVSGGTGFTVNGTLVQGTQYPSFTTAIKGISCISAGDYVSAGNVLQWENTQAWSVGCPIRLMTDLAMGAVLITSASGSPYPFPMEVFITCSGVDDTTAPTGRVCVRISSTWHTNALSVFGSTNIYDGRTHYIWVTYDGSKSASGVKIYVDGVLETMTTEFDSLTGSSVNSNPLYLGAQKNGASSNHPFSYFGPIRISNIVRDQTYITANHSSTSPPAVDANTVLAYDFTEQTGTSCNDLSASNYDGTLSSSGLWITWDSYPSQYAVQTATNSQASGTGTLTIAFPGSVTAGNLIVVGVATYGTSTTVTVSDNVSGNSYTQAGGYTTNGSSRTSIWYAKNIHGGSCTVSIAPSDAAYISANITELAGYDPTAPLDDEKTGTGTSTLPLTASVSVGGSNDIIYAVAGVAAVSTTVPNAHYELLGSVNITDRENAGFEVTFGVASGRTAGFYFPAGGAWAISAASFLAAADTTPPVVASASVNAAGTTLTVNFTEAGSPPVLPASGVTGFSISGTSASIASGTISTTTGTFSLSGTVLLTDTVLLSYLSSTGNVTDSAASPNAMATLSNHAVTNNSTQTAISFTVSPSTIPANHSGDTITLAITGSGTTFTSGSTVTVTNSLTGMTTVAKKSTSPWNRTSNTAATLIVHTGAGTGTFKITVDGVDQTGTLTVATATLGISPTSGATGMTPSLTLTGTNTLWASETASGLFSVSGGTGASIATATGISNTSATATLTVGSATGAITVTDTSTGATATFTANPPTTTYDLTSAAIGQYYVQLEGGLYQNTWAGQTAWGHQTWNDCAVRFVGTVGTVEAYVYKNGAPVRVSVDGVDTALVTLANTSAWGWVTLASGLDTSNPHAYLFSWGQLCYVQQLRTTYGTGISTARLPARKVLAGYGDSITAGDSAGGTDSTESWLHKAGLALNYQVVNRGIHSSYVVGSSGTAGEYRTADMTGLLPAADVIVSLYGTVDAENSGDVTTFGASYLNMLQKLQAGNPSAIIVCERILKASTGDTSKNAYSTKASDAVTAMANPQIVYKTGMYGAYTGTDGLHPPAADCGALATALAADVEDALGGSGGTVPAASDVRYGVAVGVITGTCHVPTAAQTLYGVSVDVSDIGTQHVPSANDVRSGTATGSTTGNATFPAVGKVQNDTSYGTSGTQYTGTLNLGLYTLTSGIAWPAQANVSTAETAWGPTGAEYHGTLAMSLYTLISGVVAAQYVLTGRDNYTGGSPGTYVAPVAAGYSVLAPGFGAAGGTSGTLAASKIRDATYGTLADGSVLVAAGGSYVDPANSAVWHGVAVGVSPRVGTKVGSSIANCSAGNVKNGVVIDDVTGSYTGSGGGGEGTYPAASYVHADAGAYGPNGNDYTPSLSAVTNWSLKSAYTNPGAANVAVGHDYVYAGASQTASYPTTATTQAADAATLTGTTLDASGDDTAVAFGASNGIAKSGAVYTTAYAAGLEAGGGGGGGFTSGDEAKLDALYDAIILAPPPWGLIGFVAGVQWTLPASGLVAPQLPIIAVGDVSDCVVSWAAVLSPDEVLVDVPTVTDAAAVTDLAIDNVAINAAELLINGAPVAAGKALCFRLSGQTIGNYTLDLTVATNAAVAQTIHRAVQFCVDS